MLPQNTNICLHFSPLSCFNEDEKARMKCNIKGLQNIFYNSINERNEKPRSVKDIFGFKSQTAATFYLIEDSHRRAESNEHENHFDQL